MATNILIRDHYIRARYMTRSVTIFHNIAYRRLEKIKPSLEQNPFMSSVHDTGEFKLI